ncbi:LysE family translocator [Spirulina sp. 06S082]|uniref:LysE family translocator n=1 Tax=Spirulina sp. 06S082 TaxID=3110248 RepID=UPI002B1F49F6|nr:LysE family translocator [Spirulina sp. 06S082]MEA5468917.1 LysE family translocator [Spirulina sp. 06S082]
MNLPLFLVAAAALVVTPGPDMLYVIARSTAQGQKSGIVSAFGVSAGILIHIFTAAIGLSSLLMTSAIAYNAVKYVGAAYLIYLGILTLTEKSRKSTLKNTLKANLKTTFFQGFLSNVLNPKVALFFLAFLPQFINSDRGNISLQIVTLGAIFILMSTLCLILTALIASTASTWLQRRSQFQRWLTGSIFIGLGARLAIPEAR